MNNRSTAFPSFLSPTSSLALTAKNNSFNSSTANPLRKQQYHRIYDDINTTTDDEEDSNSEENSESDYNNRNIGTRNFQNFQSLNKNANNCIENNSPSPFKKINSPVQNQEATNDIYFSERDHMFTSMLHKSNSYTDSMHPKGTLLKQNSADGRIAATLTDTDYYYNHEKEIPFNIKAIGSNRTMSSSLSNNSGGMLATAIYENPTLVTFNMNNKTSPISYANSSNNNNNSNSNPNSNNNNNNNNMNDNDNNIANIKSNRSGSVDHKTNNEREDDNISLNDESDDEFSISNLNDQKALLLGNSNNASGKNSRRNPTRNPSSSSSSSSVSSFVNGYNGAKPRASVCFRLHAFIQRNWYLSYLVPLSILLALMFVAYITRDYTKRLLYWIESQNPWVIFIIFILLFIIVSFPIAFGYFVLMITAGYLFGVFKGLATVILSANLGIAIAHLTIKSLRHRIPMQKIIKNETGRAILRVISGPRAFKVVLFTRLTPIPFGIQNAIFGVSTINQRIYHVATFIGLLPAQTINVYLGSTLRSMHDVLNSNGTAITGYITFGIEVICGVGLMFWVVQKARKELSETLLSDLSTEGKLIDIQV